MITFLIYLLIVVIVMALGWWVISQIPLPPPIDNIVRIVFVVVCVLIIILMLLGLVGNVPAPYPLR